MPFLMRSGLRSEGIDLPSLQWHTEAYKILYTQEKNPIYTFKIPRQRTSLSAPWQHGRLASVDSTHIQLTAALEHCTTLLHWLIEATPILLGATAAN